MVSLFRKAKVPPGTMALPTPADGTNELANTPEVSSNAVDLGVELGEADKLPSDGDADVETGAAGEESPKERSFKHLVGEAMYRIDPRFKYTVSKSKSPTRGTTSNPHQQPHHQVSLTAGPPHPTPPPLSLSLTHTLPPVRNLQDGENNAICLVIFVLVRASSHSSTQTINPNRQPKQSTLSLLINRC